MDLLGCPTTPYPAPVSPHHFSVPGDNGTSIQSHTHDHSEDCHVPSRDPLDDLCLRHVDVGSVNIATMVSDERFPPSYHLYDGQGHLEVPGLASSPSQFVGGGDPLPTEVSSAYPPDSLHHPSLLRLSELGHHYPTTSPPTPSPEINVNTHTALEHAPFQFDPPLIPTGGSSWNFHSNETGVFSASTVTYGPMRDSRAATTSLGTRSISSTPSSQTLVTSHSGFYPTNRPSNHCGSIDPFSDGDRLGPSDFRPARQGRQHTTAASPMASSQVLSLRRTSKRYRCEECDTGFSQGQALGRHLKDVHNPRQLCPLCDFKFSPGRKYILRKHFEAKHRGVALPDLLQRQGPV